MKQQLQQLLEQYGAEAFLLEIETILNSHPSTKRFCQSEEWTIIALSKDYDPDEVIRTAQLSVSVGGENGGRF